MMRHHRREAKPKSASLRPRDKWPVSTTSGGAGQAHSSQEVALSRASAATEAQAILVAPILLEAEVLMKMLTKQPLPGSAQQMRARGGQVTSEILQQLIRILH
jgi:hypothetical protein